MKYILKVMLGLLCCALLNGCWSYKGLDDIDIVTGVAVDKDEKTGHYQLTFEIADTQIISGEGETSAKYVEAEGETIFDAVRNSKKKLINKLYGGNMQALIISKKIAEEEGVSVVLEEFIRDGEPRETLSIVISQGDTAKEILKTKGIDSKIISYEIHNMVQEDSKVTAATIYVPLYKAYNAVKGTGNALVIPVVRRVKNNGEMVAEGNGIALFKNDFLKGFLSAEETMFYLFIVDELKGGAISFPINHSAKKLSMEIKNSKTDAKVFLKEGMVTVNLLIKTKLNVMELKSELDISKKEQREKLEEMTEEYIQKNITTFFQNVQIKNKIDIFGLGRLLYQKEPKLWHSVKNDWDDLFQHAVINVQVEADIISSGVLKDY